MNKRMNILTENHDVVLELVENKQGKMMVRGEFGRCAKPTKNKRVYKRSIMESNLKRLGPALKKRKVYGELDHPSDSKTKLSRVSHIITNLEINKDGIIVGEAEILNTPNGKTLQEIVKSRGAVGVSSRGFGTVTKTSEGTMEVNDDYRLKTFDFVADPAMETAYPNIVSEDVDVDQVVENGFTVETLQEEFPQLVKELTESKIDINKVVDEKVKEELKQKEEELDLTFQKKLVEAIKKAKEEATKNVRKELMEDPEIGGAKALLEKISEMVSVYNGDSDIIAYKDAIKVKDEEIEKMKQQTEEADTERRKAVFESIMHKELGYFQNSEELIENMRAKKYNSVEELEEGIEDIINKGVEYNSTAVIESNELKESVDNMSLKVEQLKEENSNLSKRETELNTKLSVMRQKIENFMENEKEYEKDLDKLEVFQEQVTLLENKVKKHRLEAYKYKRIVGLPNSMKLKRKLRNIDSKKEIDEIVERHGASIDRKKLLEQRESKRRGLSVNEDYEDELQEAQKTNKNRIGHIDLDSYNELVTD